MHGAPIQCTKGRCSKAFHVSCARDGQASGIVFRVIQEVEKDVIILDHHVGAPSPPPPPPPPRLPSPSSNPYLHLFSLTKAAATPLSVPPPTEKPQQSMDVDDVQPPLAQSCSVPSVTIPSANLPGPPIEQPHQPSSSPQPQVLKIIKKTEVEVLCHQHNPVRFSIVRVSMLC